MYMIFQEKIKNALSNINPNDFNFKDCIIAGDECIFVTPKNLGVKWTQNNKFLRSVIYRKSDYYPISLSFPKFVNLGENVENFPVPTDIHGEVVEKIDGSTLIVSKYKGELIVRTRGCLNPEKMDLAGSDIEYLKIKYPLVFKNTLEKNCSLVFEWTSARNKIIIDYGPRARLFLIAIIDHNDYTLDSQDELSFSAQKLGVERPTHHNFESIYKMIDGVKNFKNCEGVCFYPAGSNDIFKIKSLDYLQKHRLKSELFSYKNVVDLFIKLKKPTLEEFLIYIKQNYDFEICQEIKSYMEEVIDSYKKFLLFQRNIHNVSEDMIYRQLNRKSAALEILSKHKKDSYFLFKMLDNAILDDADFVKWLNL